eukprot:CAMPEP_0119080944 /NCGR_PEP_ID=MMETSP1178-20130426/114387_1 /TAXON_ID=33656 /ORGANISM="unid sp, Strain CCMP2000" /LENGTH=97 /DNA_ID=CAMNT_0007063587 /DNA_START=11 /DNA_END=304 /DNA_ORIENTATION=-
MCKWNSGECSSTTQRVASARSPDERNSRKHRSSASLNSGSVFAGVEKLGAAASTGSSSARPSHSAIHFRVGTSPAMPLGPLGRTSAGSVLVVGPIAS